MSRRVLAGIALFAATCAPAAAQPPAGNVEVRAWVDRTALWPGDRVLYTVEVRCAPGIDVLAEDLAGERLVLSGLELVSTSRERQARDDGGTIHRARHELTAYDIGTPLRIQEQTLRYFARRPGPGTEDAAPAGEVKVPASSLAMRSTLADEPGDARLRDDAAAPPLPAFLAWMRPAGLALVLLCGLPVAAWAISALRGRWRRRGARPRHSRLDLRPEVRELQAMDASAPAARRLGYDRLDHLLRRRLGDVVGKDARALTASEIAARLESGAGLPDSLPVVLEECERARYGGSDALPSPERFAAGVAAAAALLGARRWS